MEHSHTQKTNETINQDYSRAYDMVVFCHLRWGFVYQRPQHIISRMASVMRVLFIEEPIGYATDEENTGNLIKVSDNLHILQPKVRSIEAIAGILPQYIANNQVSIGWFYSAAFTPLINALSFETVVYDCMDELTLFKGAPIQLVEQEKNLLSQADIVFTGGRSLYESKKTLHDAVYCFPSSVDQKHFGKALNGLAVPADIANLPHPIVGYCGVIDERIDLQLLHETARRMPDVTFVMIGPLAKIQESDLPREANIYYPGMRAYDELPAYMKGFDIAMMPFALNDSTKFISPTKTLEYMAAGKPIISTRIKDVVRDYSGTIEFASDPTEFCNAIIVLLRNKAQEEYPEYREILEKTSWDTTASAMKSIVKPLTK